MKNNSMMYTFNEAELNIMRALDAAQKEEINPRIQICRMLGQGYLNENQALELLDIQKETPVLEEIACG